MLPVKRNHVAQDGSTGKSQQLRRNVRKSCSYKKAILSKAVVMRERCIPFHKNAYNTLCKGVMYFPAFYPNRKRPTFKGLNRSSCSFLHPNYQEHDRTCSISFENSMFPKFGYFDVNFSKLRWEQYTDNYDKTLG